MEIMEQSREIQGNKVTEIIIKNRQGLVARFSSLGARITGLAIPGKQGLEELILTLPDLTDEYHFHTYYGATVGRVAGRIGGGALALSDGQPLTLTANEGPTHLHGGLEGWDLANWDYRIEESEAAVAVHFSLTDPAGHNGYPGNLTCHVTHTIGEDNSWTVGYEAYSDALTYWNPTNHVYFNLSGNARDLIHAHILTLAADRVMPVDSQGLPLAASWAVEEHPLLDFRKGQRLGDCLAHTASCPQLADRGGLDHAFLLNHPGLDQGPQGQLHLPGTQRRIRVTTDRPSAVIYTHNHQLPGLVLGGQAQRPYIGVSFETQIAPDAPHWPEVGSIELPAEQWFSSQTRFEVLW